LGHEVVGSTRTAAAIGEVTQRSLPDVAVVCLDSRAGAQLGELADQVIADSACPVIGIVTATDHDGVLAVAARGVFDCVVDRHGVDLGQAIDGTLRRFAGYAARHGGFAAQAVVEQAKGILMAARRIDADAAGGLLHDRAELLGVEVGEVAQALVTSHPLLVGSGLDAATA
jgi:AmiR/NasT family two-component response regulator